MRLIDADALLERIAKRKQEVYDQSFAPDPYRDGYDCCRFDELNIVRNMTKNARTIDPYKHEHWIEDELKGSLSVKIKYQCPACGVRTAYASNFCSNCGSKMDKTMKDK